MTYFRTEPISQLICKLVRSPDQSEWFATLRDIVQLPEVPHART